MSNFIFVFGSNLSGVHGAGAAKYAVDHYGARMGQGIGLHGQSYAIPTKGHLIETLPIPLIWAHVGDFKDIAASYPSTIFRVTQIGCGLAGYTAEQIAPMFKSAPKNCQFDTSWKSWIGENYTYWGNVK